MLISRGKAGATLALALSVSIAHAADLPPDGVASALGGELLRRFAPLVLLHPTEPVRPSSAEWLLARAELEPAPGHPPRVLAASILGAFATLAPPVENPEARLHIAPGAREGSADLRDWVTYGHAYRAAGGGMLLQYWFFYPFNDAFWLFDHDGDWEHVTVKLDAAMHPEGAYYARHDDGHPGAFFRWTELTREGEHPLVFAGRGTHASYASGSEAPFWERVCPEAEPSRAEEAGCTVWRTWAPSTGGVMDLGDRSAPHLAFLTWPGRWGATGRLGMDSRTLPPHGPAFQEGWCSGAAPGGCP